MRPHQDGSPERREVPEQGALRVLAATTPARSESWLGGLQGVALEVVVLTRSDLWPEHWHKSRSPEVAERWRDALKAHAPDVAVVDGWLGASDDHVRVAARASVPSVLILDGHEATCALGSRRRSSDGTPCDAIEGLHACLSCASAAPPRADWLPQDEQVLRFMQRRTAIEAELATARVIGTRSRPHAAVLRDRGVALPSGPVVLDSADSWQAALYRAHSAGAPRVAAEGWFEARMTAEGLRVWDAAARATGRE